MTPRSFCVGPTGKPKAAFLAKPDAKRVARRIFVRTGDPVHLYRCPSCHCYHIGIDRDGGHAA